MLFDGEVETPSPIASTSTTKYFVLSTTLPAPTNCISSCDLPPSHVGHRIAFDFAAFNFPICAISQLEVVNHRATLQFQIAQRGKLLRAIRRLFFRGLRPALCALRVRSALQKITIRNATLIAVFMFLDSSAAACSDWPCRIRASVFAFSAARPLRIYAHVSDFPHPIIEDSSAK